MNAISSGEPLPTMSRSRPAAVTAAADIFAAVRCQHPAIKSKARLFAGFAELLKIVSAPERIPALPEACRRCPTRALPRGEYRSLNKDLYRAVRPTICKTSLLSTYTIIAVMGWMVSVALTNSGSAPVITAFGEGVQILSDGSVVPAAQLSMVMVSCSDGRESMEGRSIHDDLISQARDATLGHARATASPTDAQLEDIVNFEMALFAAQSSDREAGPLDADQAQGGPVNLSNQNFFLGINDEFSSNFNPVAMTLYPAWLNPTSGPNNYIEARQSIARGEALFDSKPIAITGVAGINDVLNQAVVMGTCTTCHDTPNVGNHSLSTFINIGVTAGQPVAPLDVTGLPVFTLTCATSTGSISVDTTDPGRALITGKCADIGKTKTTILRGLAARAPYFHNGSGTTLNDVVEFYNTRFNIGLTAQEKTDLVNALNAF